MKKKGIRLLKAVLLIVFFWVLLTVWAESKGPKSLLYLGSTGTKGVALIVYDPDPFYNLDQQLCETFGKKLADNGWRVTIASVAAASQSADSSYDLYVFCANTYNWAPDWALSRFVKNHTRLEGKNTVAIIVGGGTTGRSQRLFESLIKFKNAKLIDSRAFWLWRPNDESRPKQSNVSVANDMVRSWAKDITTQLNEQ
jgi:hypothetical protein